MQERKKVTLSQAPLSRYIPTQGKSNMMQKQQASPKRPSPYMRTAMTNRFVHDVFTKPNGIDVMTHSSLRNEKKKAAPNMRNLPQQKQGVTRLSIPRGKPQKRMQLSVGSIIQTN